MTKENLRTIYLIGDFTRGENISIVALAMMAQEGTGFIQMGKSGFREFQRLTGYEPGTSDGYLCELTECKYLVWPKKDIAMLNWDKIKEDKQ
jgi:hypothetical protein